MMRAARVKTYFRHPPPRRQSWFLETGCTGRGVATEARLVVRLWRKHVTRRFMALRYPERLRRCLGRRRSRVVLTAARVVACDRLKGPMVLRVTTPEPPRR